MSVIVTLDVYSGRPNPTWELDQSDSARLAGLLQAPRARTLLKPEGVSGRLGYRGFVIKAVGEAELESEVYVHGGVADLGRFDTNLLYDNVDIERFLLSTAGGAVDTSVAKFVDQALDLTDLGRFYEAPEAMAAPTFDPGKWNNDPNIRSRNNCYNYGNDKITNSFAQPGRGSGQMYSAMDCANVSAASKRDGQVSIPNPNMTPAQGHIIALVIWPGEDFHWYRRDSNGMWSHKPGRTPARNTDNSGAPISNPETCDRGPYTQFCGYFNSIPANTRIA